MEPFSVQCAEYCPGGDISTCSHQALLQLLRGQLGLFLHLLPQESPWRPRQLLLPTTTMLSNYRTLGFVLPYDAPEVSLGTSSNCAIFLYPLPCLCKAIISSLNFWDHSFYWDLRPETCEKDYGDYTEKKLVEYNSKYTEASWLVGLWCGMQYKTITLHTGALLD